MVIVDQLTRICTIVPTKDKTAFTAAKILVERWLSFFPDPAFIISDGGTHFKNTLFKSLANIRGFQHHITAPYSQWGNGGVERLNLETVKSFKKVIASTDREISEWPALAPAVQECLNKSMPVSNRDRRTPMELLTGLAPRTAIDQIAWLGVDATLTPVPVSDEQLRESLAPVHAALRGLWDKAVRSQTKRAARNRRNKPTAVLPRINIGDMVLVAEAVKDNKLKMTWTGPHEIIDTVSPFVYVVRPMLRVPNTRKPKTVHIVRIRRFSAGALATDADREAIERAALRDYPDNVVQRFLSHTFGPGAKQPLLIRVRWLGYDAAHDTDEPATSLVQDVPDMVEEYLRRNKSEPACARMLKRYFK